jgi:hypothetical protein
MSDKAERVAKSRHAAECLWRDLPLNADGTFRSTISSLDTIEKHMVAFLEGHRPDLDISEAEKALCMDILGERGRSVDEVNRLATLLIDYREGLKAQTAPDLSELREALEGLYKIIMDEGARGVDDTIDKRSMIATAAALLRSEPKLGGTV